MKMYSIVELGDTGKLFQCICRVQDGTERWIEETREKAVSNLIGAAKTLNGATINEEDIYFEHVYLWQKHFEPCISHSTSAEANPLATVMQAVDAEYRRAVSLHGSFNSTHEGYAIIKEEMDELWDGIKKNDDRKLLEEEAIQIAAMAIRFCIDI